MMKHNIAVIDDDPFVVTHLKRTFAARLPDAAVHGVSSPIAPAGYDVYIVDKDFSGISRGADVVSRIQAVAPDALVIAYSAFLDREFLRKLLARKCAGAFDKGSLEELDQMMTLVSEFLASRSTESRRKVGLRGAIQSITSLLREWNLRLEQGSGGRGQ